MAKVVRTLREHWKKSTFAAVLGYFGIDYAYDRHKTFLMMRDYSIQALANGRRPLPQGAKNKHITLLLNPAAGNRKAKAKLEKYAEPLLHLSGFLVNVVKTERIDEARDLAGIIEKTNIIAVAGGDGTIFETVTGLLRRDDADEAVTKYPVGIIPVGLQNKFGEHILRASKESNEAKFIAEAAMAIINHRTRPVDVMEIQIADAEKGEVTEETTKKTRKPFYSLVGLSMGQYREAKKWKDEMPSLFGKFFSTFWSLLRVQPQVVKAQLNYIPTCPGCAKCKQEQEEKAELQKLKAAENRKSEQQPTQSIWSRFTSTFARPVLADEKDLDEVNPDCGVEKSLCIESTELNVTVAGGGVLRVEIGRRLERTDFMIEGLKRLRGEPAAHSLILECKEVELCPVPGGPEYFAIDNEEFEVKKVRLKAVQDRVYFFTP